MAYRFSLRQLVYFPAISILMHSPFLLFSSLLIVWGGLKAVVTIDLYDPRPEESGGLVRPYELFKNGITPLE